MSQEPLVLGWHVNRGYLTRKLELFNPSVGWERWWMEGPNGIACKRILREMGFKMYRVLEADMTVDIGVL